ncbi:hypothetical protein DTO212C5_8502 [Paecilomyces variotii]|nr:hypothetical protein DTO212C5_8502 [Paecilomyces variotii]
MPERVFSSGREEDKGTVAKQLHSQDETTTAAVDGPSYGHQVSRDIPADLHIHTRSSFHRLPSHVILRILYIVDANSFASLCLLNRQWKRLSDSAPLYAYHLSRCPSFSLTSGMISGSLTSDDLPRLKARFACEIRRNAFEAFLRPRKTLIKLISNSSSSTAFPFGEAFRFRFSSNGQMLLSLSSSRTFVIDLSSRFISVKHELKTLRRPLDAAILDDGSLLAVVSSKHQVNIYRLTDDEAKHVQVLTLDESPRALALSPSGSIIAIAYDSGIEFCSVGENVLASERRAVRCIAVDILSFSCDGTLLLGSSADVTKPSTVAVSALFNPDAEIGLATREAQSHMWTRQILFPDVISGYSHMCLLPHHPDGNSSWVIGYDTHLKTFRAVRVNNARTASVYFVGPHSNGSLQETEPLMVPATDSEGELVALGFRGSGLWLYGLPEQCDPATFLGQSRQANETSDAGLDNGVQNFEEEHGYMQNDASGLQDRINQPGILLHGHKLSDMEGITAAEWVLPRGASQGDGLRCRRLVAVAPGGVSSPMLGGENVPIDGGRVLIMDFERSPTDGEMKEITIEVGETQPKLLREQSPSLDTEVELERRRTQFRRLIGSPRHGTSQRSSRPRESFPAATRSPQKLLSTTSTASRSQPSSPTDMEFSHLTQMLDVPYDNAQPRSRDTLQRAATAAAASRSRYNTRYRDTGSNPVIEPQVPHESDADNWVPPPPPYTREPDGPLPEHLRRLLLPAVTGPAQSLGGLPSQSERAGTSSVGTLAQNTIMRSRTTIGPINTNSRARLAPRRPRSSRESPIPDHGSQDDWQRGRLQGSGGYWSSTSAEVNNLTGAASVQSANYIPEPNSAITAAATVTAGPSDNVHLNTEPWSGPTGQVRDPESLSVQIVAASPVSPMEQSVVGATLQEPADLPAPIPSEPAAAPRVVPVLELPLPQSQRETRTEGIERRRTLSRPRSFVPRLLSPSRNQKSTLSSKLRRVSLFPPRPLHSQNNSSTENYHAYSLSSPDLHARRPHRNQPNGLQSLEPQYGAHRPDEDSRRRSHDALGSMAPGNRASTDPLYGRLPGDERSEEWRLRIEQWNEQTIQERRERNSKCLVM